jgi:hypothetical protein
LGLLAEAGYPELIIPMKDGLNVPVKVINGGSTRDGARDEELELLRELIDTLRAKEMSPTVSVNLDADSLADYTGRYVSERTRRRTLDVRSG